MPAPLSLRDEIPVTDASTTAGRWSRARDRIGLVACGGVDNAMAIGYATCPYYRGVAGGRCLGSCYDEPACHADEPEEGWQPRAADGHLYTSPELNQIAADDWESHVAAEIAAEIRANVCTPTELAAIRRQDEEDEAEGDRLEAELRARCTHDHIEHGLCAGCGQFIDIDTPEPTSCGGRGWYHDGSEEQAAAATGRPTQLCPHCT